MHRRAGSISNHNDAFSSIRLDSHRNFLRLRIKGDDVSIYPVV
jgi:hypothetical protein